MRGLEYRSANAKTPNQHPRSLPASERLPALGPDHTATLICEDGNGNALHQEALTFTDFPLEEIKFYVTNHTILLPSEY